MTPSGVRTRGPRPFEIVALAWLLGVTALLALLGAPPSLASLSRVARLLVVLVPATLLIGLALQALHRWAVGEGVRSTLRAATETGALLLWLRLWLAVAMTSYAYFWLKLSVPLLNDASWDQALWNLDRALHFGVSPNTLAVGWATPSLALRLLDVYYALWLPSVVVGMSYFAAWPDAAVRRAFVLSCLLLWITGACVYALLPAVGPIYAFPSVWNELRGAQPFAEATQASLWSSYQAVLAGGTRGAGVDYTRGVAALPSLHVAFHVLFALWSWRLARRALPLFAAAVALTLVGSVVTGWHYAVDGYLGAALAAGAFAVSIRLEIGVKNPLDPEGN